MAINPNVVEARRILGTGIVLTGLVVLSIGLIIGLEFPKHMREKKLASLCITSSASHDYKDWVIDDNRTRYHYLRVYNFTNVQDVLTRNATPKLELLGPYVFREKEMKVGVRFYDGLIDYKSFKRQEFDANATKSVCPRCLLNDTVYTVNPAFLQLLDVFDDPLYFYISLVPQVLSKMPPNSSHHFDSWIGKGDTDYKKLIMADKRRQNVPPSVYVSLNQTVGNGSVYGSDVLRWKGKWNSCADALRVFYGGRQLSTTSAFNDIVKLNTTLNIINTIDRLLSDGFSGGPRQKKPSGRPKVSSESRCGLAFYLIQLAATSLFNWILIRPILTSLLCQQNQSCFLNDLSSSNVTVAYVAALVNYTVYYLPRVLSAQHSKTTFFTKSDVRSVVLGYYADGQTLQKLNCSQRDPPADYVRGFLEHYDTEDEAHLYSPVITLKSCLYNRSRDDNLSYKAVNGQPLRGRLVSDAVNETDFGGYQDYKIPPSKFVSSCGTSQPFYKQFKMYLPQLLRSVLVTLVGTSDYKSVTLHRFVMKSMESVLFTGDVTGYLSWVLPSSVEYRQLDDNRTVENHTEPEVLVESVTGKIWVTVTNIGFYVGLKKNLFGMNKSSPSDDGLARLLDKPIPYFHLYSRTEPNLLTLSAYNTKVRLFLQTSCGGLIGLSIVGSIIILTGIGVAMAVIERPPHRVTPLLQNNYVVNNDISVIS